jgi:hypothetical protein
MVHSKTVILHSIIEQVSHLKYISYETDYDVKSRIHQFQAVCRMINRTLKRRMRKEKEVKSYTAMALLTLSHSSENWAGNNNGAGKSKLEVKSCVSKDTPN